MKNILLIAVLLCLPAMALQAQTLPGNRSTQSPLTNIAGNANAITGKLNKALSLDEEQEPKVLNAITAFLKQRAGILPLADSNEKAYTTKLGSLQNGFYRKMKGILTAAQYAGFQELKPATPESTNVLSQLFY